MWQRAVLRNFNGNCAGDVCITTAIGNNINTIIVIILVALFSRKVKTASHNVVTPYPLNSDDFRNFSLVMFAITLYFVFK